MGNTFTRRRKTRGTDCGRQDAIEMHRRGGVEACFGEKTAAGARKFVSGSKLCTQPSVRPSIHPSKHKISQDDGSRSQSPLLPGLPDDLVIACLIRVPRMEHRKLRLVCKRWYRLLAGNYFYSLRRSLGIAEVWIHVMKRDRDGRISWHAFDPTHQLWQPLPPVPKEYSAALGFGCAVLSSCHLYLFGGKDPLKGSMRRVVYYSARTMSNGSLDTWIFNSQRNREIEWQTRKKIVLGIAKGLTYLHDECLQRIIHLDIKPHNILLDDNFNAKVSDFGLSKQMDRDQSQVQITMQGTPGYIAPEWRQLRVSLKFDIYSFGIVVLETVCGRRNFDSSRSESNQHLLRLLQEKAEADRLLDIVEGPSTDMQLHGDEVLKMIQLASWCLQDDHTRRPQMSVVVKVLEGAMEVEPNISYRFCNAMTHTSASDLDDVRSWLCKATRFAESRNWKELMFQSTYAQFCSCKITLDLEHLPH
ncbi:hypothetical protein ACLOJK_030391 [Asimina triloba]